MNLYTQYDFEMILPDQNGYKHLPSGDWSGVKFSAERRLVFGDGCTLGNRCTLGDGCVLGNRCTLGEKCMLESGRVKNATYFFVSNIGSENRTAYCYCNTLTGEIFVRAGCWFGGMDLFEARVKFVHGGTQHETDYLSMAAFAKARFARYIKGVPQ